MPVSSSGGAVVSVSISSISEGGVASVHVSSNRGGMVSLTISSTQGGVAFVPVSYNEGDMASVHVTPKSNKSGICVCESQ